MENTTEKPITHGTRVGYQRFHCRCNACREAERLYNVKRREKPGVREKETAKAARYAAKYPERRAESAARWRAKNPEKVQSGQKVRYMRFRLKKYSLTDEQYNAMLVAQGGVCAICHSPDSRNLSADHDHISGRVRGLLCRRCNLGLGCFGDDTDLLAAAIGYLNA